MDRPAWKIRGAAGTLVWSCRSSSPGRIVPRQPDPLDKETRKSLMPNYLKLPVGAKAPEVVNAVIEIPYQGRMKFEYDKQLEVFRLDRNLYSPVHYPGDYGFLPSTLGDDGDPLDVLVLVDEPSFPGCLQEVRPIGLMEMIDGDLSGFGRFRDVNSLDFRRARGRSHCEPPRAVA